MPNRFEQERTRLIAWLEGHQLPVGTRIDREATADALMMDFIAPLLAELAALRAQDREGAREMPCIQEHRVVTLRYMLERAERMHLCFYRAGMREDGARYREEADALTWVLAALPLSPVRSEDGSDA